MSNVALSIEESLDNNLIERKIQIESIDIKQIEASIIMIINTALESLNIQQEQEYDATRSN